MSMISKILELIVLLAILGALIYLGMMVVPTIGVINTQSRQDIIKDIQDIVKDQDVVKDIAVCIIDPKLPNNPVYYNLPTVVTQLVCDGPLGISMEINTTLDKLYADGWSLVQIIDPSIEITQGEQKHRSRPAIYLERTKPR